MGKYTVKPQIKAGSRINAGSQIQRRESK